MNFKQNRLEKLICDFHLGSSAFPNYVTEFFNHLLIQLCSCFLSGGENLWTSEIRVFDLLFVGALILNALKTQ